MTTCNIHFICLIQIQKTEIYTAYRKSAKKYRDIHFCLYLPALIHKYKSKHEYIYIYTNNMYNYKEKHFTVWTQYAVG